MSSHNAYKFVMMAWLVLLSACVSDDEEAALIQQLNENRSVWQESAIPNYTLNYLPICFCQEENVSVSVVNQEIVAVQIRDGDDNLIQDVEAEEFSDYLNVEGFFDLIERAIDSADVVQPEYHPEFGYTTNLFIEYNTSVTDTSVRYRIEFQPM